MIRHETKYIGTDAYRVYISGEDYIPRKPLSTKFQNVEEIITGRRYNPLLATDAPTAYETQAVTDLAELKPDFFKGKEQLLASFVHGVVDLYQQETAIAPQRTDALMPMLMHTFNALATLSSEGNWQAQQIAAGYFVHPNPHIADYSSEPLEKSPRIYPETQASLFLAGYDAWVKTLEIALTQPAKFVDKGQVPLGLSFIFNYMWAEEKRETRLKSIFSAMLTKTPELRRKLEACADGQTAEEVFAQFVDHVNEGKNNDPVDPQHEAWVFTIRTILVNHGITADASVVTKIARRQELAEINHESFDIVKAAEEVIGKSLTDSVIDSYGITYNWFYTTKTILANHGIAAPDSVAAEVARKRQLAEDKGEMFDIVEAAKEVASQPASSPPPFEPFEKTPEEMVFPDDDEMEQWRKLQKSVYDEAVQIEEDRRLLTAKVVAGIADIPDVSIDPKLLEKAAVCLAQKLMQYTSRVIEGDKGFNKQLVTAIVDAKVPGMQEPINQLRARILSTADPKKASADTSPYLNPDQIEINLLKLPLMLPDDLPGKVEADALRILIKHSFPSQAEALAALTLYGQMINSAQEYARDELTGTRIADTEIGQKYWEAKKQAAQQQAELAKKLVEEEAKNSEAKQKETIRAVDAARQRADEFRTKNPNATL